MRAKTRILLVKSKELLRASTREALREQGIEPVCVPDGAEALRALAQQTFAATIVDIELPDFHSPALVRYFRAQNSSMPLVLCGPFDSAAHASLFRGDPLCRVIDEPFGERRLLRELRDLGVAIPESLSAPGY
jgi:DNA-binding response OmpR family regulator